MQSIHRFCLALPLLWCAFLSPVLGQQVSAAIDRDPLPDKQFPAIMSAFQIPSHGSGLNAIAYIASGAGPHPVVVLLHGFPGNEKNLDLAQAIRRAGWDVLFFNYRGSWGTPGDFSFTHSTEDVDAALDFLREPANAAKLRGDPSRIVLIGHSMGGFLAAFGGAHDARVLGVGMISAADFGAMASAALPGGKDDGKDGSADESAAVGKIAPKLEAEDMKPLSGCTAESLARELLAHRTAWDFTTYAVLLGQRPVLLITSDDGLATASDSLGRALRESGSEHVTQAHFAADHAYSEKRIALEEAVLGWLAGVAR